ncbi:hypothetical protein [Haloferula sp. BvORR071]|uniref:hypothetical protein n=1 Tax=Haloferula sp. BvORR071 TaxID=1396141 RepID=UPI000558A8C8|nr:hypothetical protein [Haloferula sp. BvORR071]
MENSETPAKAIRLGKELVVLLEQEERATVLTRWMAHYLAEQMTLAETVNGVERAEAEEKCFKTVLALWQARGDWPSGRRPFERFEPIFEALTRLNPDDPRPFFYRRRLRSQVTPSDEEDPEVLDVAEAVEVIDATARILIEAVLEEAAEMAASEGTKRLLQEAIPEKGIADLHIIGRLLNIDASTVKDPRAERAMLLTRRIERLDSFAEICRKLRRGFLADLKSLKKAPK